MFSLSPDSPIGDPSELPQPAGRNWKDYAPAYNSAFVTALLIQGFCLLLTALLLDGGRMFRCTLIAILSQLFATWIILFRRPMNPTATDLMIVKYGFLAMLVTVAAFGWPLVQLLGLER